MTVRISTEDELYELAEGTRLRSVDTGEVWEVTVDTFIIYDGSPPEAMEFRYVRNTAGSEILDYSEAVDEASPFEVLDEA